MVTGEGIAVMNDANGNLLFYTDGRTIWNKNHAQMTNGDNLEGSSSSTQSAIIIPFPCSSCKKYIVFTVGDSGTYTNKRNLKYTIVGFTNNPLGEVPLGNTNKNFFLRNKISEKLTAVRGANANEYFVVAHGYDDTVNGGVNREYYVYRVNCNGVNETSTTYLGNAFQNGTGSLWVK